MAIDRLAGRLASVRGPAVRSVFLLFLAACGMTEPSDVTLHIEGRVTARSTPVEGARVNLYRYQDLINLFPGDFASTRTDSQGKFSLVYTATNCRDYLWLVYAFEQSRGPSTTVDIHCTGERQTAQLSWQQ